ncbi:MAG: sigma-54 interaction domain-containing protein [Gemmatimonadaceae bacterium]
MTHAPAILGTSAPVQEALRLAGRFARSPHATVLLIGETGTGKELFARAIHAMGEPEGAFVAVNCAAIPAQLLESELFGHEKGAFTDAKSAKPGLFEAAARGTLFLDEIGELEPAMQAKLLRVLEARTVRRVGALRDTPVTCRVVAATNVSLEDAVIAKSFRADLYYRLNVFRIDLPALRERPEDVEPLAHAFLVDAVAEHCLHQRHLDVTAIAALQRHHWPGNVRELRNVIHRAAVMSDHAAIGAAELSLQPQPALVKGAMVRALAASDGGAGIRIPSTGKDFAEIEREALLITLSLAGGNQSAAARMLGLSRATLMRKLREYAHADAVRAETPALPLRAVVGA